MVNVWLDMGYSYCLNLLCPLHSLNKQRTKCTIYIYSTFARSMTDIKAEGAGSNHFTLSQISSSQSSTDIAPLSNIWELSVVVQLYHSSCSHNSVVCDVVLLLLEFILCSFSLAGSRNLVVANQSRKMNSNCVQKYGHFFNLYLKENTSTYKLGSSIVIPLSRSVCVYTVLSFLQLDHTLVQFQYL